MTVETQETQAPGQPPAAGVQRALALGILVILLAFTVGLMVVSVPAGVYAVFSGRLSPISYTTPGHPYFWIGPFLAILPVTVGIGYWFLGLTVLYCLFFAYSVWQRQGPLQAIRGSFRGGVSSLTTSPFLVIVIATGFLTFSASIIDSFTSSAGVPIGGPSGDPLPLLVSFTTSPLVEEVGFRVLLIGVVALILSMGRPARQALASLWRPSRAMEGLAVGSGASVIIWAATGLSAATFGACHVLCGSAWDIGKFPEAAFGGVVLGVLYVKYGLHVSVLVHWGINYFGTAYAFFGQAAYGIPWSSGTNEFFGQLLVDIDMILLFGFASFLLVVYLVIRRLVRLRSPAAQEFDKGPPGGGQVEV